jgi:hypothetical protein
VKGFTSLNLNPIARFFRKAARFTRVSAVAFWVNITAEMMLFRCAPLTSACNYCYVPEGRSQRNSAFLSSIYATFFRASVRMRCCQRCRHSPQRTHRASSFIHHATINRVPLNRLRDLRIIASRNVSRIYGLSARNITCGSNATIANDESRIR